MIVLVWCPTCQRTRKAYLVGTGAYVCAYGHVCEPQASGGD